MKYENELEIRKDFARLFGWYKLESFVYPQPGKQNPSEPEWSEIFCEIGKLLNKKDEYTKTQCR